MRWVDERPLLASSPTLTLANLDRYLPHIDRRCRSVLGRSAQSLGLTLAVLRTVIQQTNEPVTINDLVERLISLAKRVQEEAGG